MLDFFFFLEIWGANPDMSSLCAGRVVRKIKFHS